MPTLFSRAHPRPLSFSRREVLTYLGLYPGALATAVALLWPGAASRRRGETRTDAEAAREWADGVLRRLCADGLARRERGPRLPCGQTPYLYSLTRAGGAEVGVEVADAPESEEAPKEEVDLDALPPLPATLTRAERLCLIALFALGGPATPAYLAEACGLTRTEVREALLSLGRRGEVGTYPGGCVVLRRRAQRRAG